MHLVRDALQGKTNTQQLTTSWALGAVFSPSHSKEREGADEALYTMVPNCDSRAVPTQGGKVKQALFPGPLPEDTPLPKEGRVAMDFTQKHCLGRVIPTQLQEETSPGSKVLGSSAGLHQRGAG